ncbi:hypothetical protein GALMADRAFT_892347 [Galerina marginata CBS 339.88]|uniref:Uncharacterized protein n=1 Tax=Galerina marginata (strain CBS 339.88) TaxID=685588 RepID=A0A067SR96_GALM3|nr:hypothetical protein GALMADRAFT_892347 [Galerina marginata CBS 339.88]
MSGRTFTTASCLFPDKPFSRSSDRRSCGSALLKLYKSVKSYKIDDLHSARIAVNRTLRVPVSQYRCIFLFSRKYPSVCHLRAQLHALFASIPPFKRHRTAFRVGISVYSSTFGIAPLFKEITGLTLNSLTVSIIVQGPDRCSTYEKQNARVRSTT